MNASHAAEQRLLIALARIPPRVSAGDLDAPATRWDQIGVTAIAHGVAPLAYRALSAPVAAGQASRPVRDLAARCRALYVHNVARNACMFDELRRVLRGFGQAGIPVALLKGAAMASTLYGDIGLRYMGDLDLLVPVDARVAGLAVLESLGYRLDPGVPADLRAKARRDRVLARSAGPEDEATTAAIYARYHFHYYLRRSGQFFPLELHWHIAKPGTRVAIADLWREARAVEIAGIETLCLRPEHLLLHLCLHLAADNYRQLRLSRLVDIDVAVRGQRLDWAYLGHAAHEYGVTRPVRVVLGLTRRILGTAVPEAVVAGGDGLERLLLRLTSRVWLADFGARAPHEPSIVRGLCWSLLAARRWRDIGAPLYRAVIPYPDKNPFLPPRYAGSEPMNLLYGLHPSRLRRLWRPGTRAVAR